MFKKDQFGWEYYEELPQGYREATIDDFHSNGRIKAGMEFLIKWASRDYYEKFVMDGFITAGWLKAFIDGHRVFVKDDL